MKPISRDEIAKARQVFATHEPRDLFYRVATELVELAIAGKVSLSLAEAIAVLLQTWNHTFYRFRQFDNQHFMDLERRIEKHYASLIAFRERRIETLTDTDATAVLTLFHDFETLLGPVGASKCLHLLAPYFFPLWDQSIAKAYGVPLGRTGTNAKRYWDFMWRVREQVSALGSSLGDDANPLKAIDEYNYCKYTKKWM